LIKLFTDLSLTLASAGLRRYPGYEEKGGPLPGSLPDKKPSK
jgi:hypothetical protein